MDSYYRLRDLEKFGDIGKEAPELAARFFDYYNSVFEEGELTGREKALIALAVAHAVQCPYCIDAYTNHCLSLGISKEEMMEAQHVGAVMMAGIVLAHTTQMRKIIKKKEM